MKGFIFGSKIFQFRGANKGKVCRVEEKEGPFTKNVFLAHVCEFIMVKGLDGKITDFFVDETHNVESSFGT